MSTQGCTLQLKKIVHCKLIPIGRVKEYCKLVHKLTPMSQEGVVLHGPFVIRLPVWPGTVPPCFPLMRSQPRDGHPPLFERHTRLGFACPWIRLPVVQNLFDDDDDLEIYRYDVEYDDDVRLMTPG